MAAGLMHANTEGRFLVFDDRHNGDVLMTNGSSTAGFPSDTPWQTMTFDNESIPPIQWVDVTRRTRSRERGQEEQSRMRRHREAIVMAERGQPLSQESVFESSAYNATNTGPGLVEMVNVERRRSGESAIDSPSEASADSMPDLDERVLHLHLLNLQGPHEEGSDLGRQTDEG